MFKLIIILRREVDDEVEAKRICDRILIAANSEENLEMQARITQEVPVEE